MPRRTIREHGPDPVDAHVGRRVRELRVLAGLSQDALAQRVGITFQQLQKYESGANRISAGRLWRLAEALGAPVAWFFEDMLEPPPVRDN